MRSPTATETAIRSSALLFAVLVCAALTVRQTGWNMTENLRIGDATGASPASFTSIAAVAVARNGTIFVLDAPPIQLRAFDRTGAFLRIVATGGQGPGELSRPTSMLFVKDSLWVIDPQGGRVNVYGPDGTFGRQIARVVSFVPRWMGTIDATGRILDPVWVSNGRKDKATGHPLTDQRLRRFNTDGQPIDTVPFPGCASSRPAGTPYYTVRSPDGRSVSMARVPYVAYEQTAFGPDGLIWCSPRDEYVVYRLEIGRTDTLHTIRRGGGGPPIPRALRDSIVRLYSPLASGSVTTFKLSMIPRTYPAIADLRVDDSGRLWIRKTDTPAMAPIFELFDRNGAYLGAARAGFPVQGIPVVIGDTAYAVSLNAEDVPFVVRANLKRSNER